MGSGRATRTAHAPGTGTLGRRLSSVSTELTAQVALGLSVLLGLWELSKYVLKGGRVRVHLHAGMLYDSHLLTEPTWQRVQKAATAQGWGWPVEVAVVEVENRGRTPVTITSVALDLGRASKWRPWRRLAITPRPLRTDDATLAWRTRLEPFDNRRYVFDVWRVLEPSSGAAHARPMRPLRVRASVKVAGRRWRPMSSWRKGWPVAVGQVSLTGGAVEIGVAAYRSIWRHAAENGLDTGVCIPTALAVRDRFPAHGSPPTKDDLQAILTEKHYAGPPPGGGLMAAFYMERELQPFYERQPQT